ncbi:hypothetical protein CBZ_16840 [Cellulomonas biazotea]|uniref:Uncharacterized protein n=1 Tax=Cellulomonas biazotea TaxID=1709 RepID=A0A402DR96_9CELL|nr:hypothetical protein CBZ_16840 [Cellulomonas biazotea]
MAVVVLAVVGVVAGAASAQAAATPGSRVAVAGPVSGPVAGPVADGVPADARDGHPLGPVVALVERTVTVAAAAVTDVVLLAAEHVHAGCDAVAGWWAASAPEWVRGVARSGIALWELREAAREALDL